MAREPAPAILSARVPAGTRWGSGRRVPGLHRAARWALAALALALFTAALHRYASTDFLNDNDPANRLLGLIKGCIALAAMAILLRPRIPNHAQAAGPSPWSRVLACTLAAAAMVAYFNGFRIKPVHLHDQFHYVLGAKYFPELGYERLYLCTLVAQSAPVAPAVPVHRTGPILKIRDLAGTNALLPAAPLLAQAQRCTAHFSAARWQAFRNDVAMFRSLFPSTREWRAVLMDHGYNPPPAWTAMGRFWTSLHALTPAYLQFLASLDLILMAGMFAALAWSFGWRVTALAATFFGTQAIAPMPWTGGGFLRQDWLFLLVLCVCLAHKRYFRLAGACIAWSALLRIFPALLGMGLSLAAAARSPGTARSTHTPCMQFMSGAGLALAVLLPWSVYASGWQAYADFYHHTLQSLERTPLANHMGLKVLFSQPWPPFQDAGRMAKLGDVSLADPWERWKSLRISHYQHYRLLVWGLTAALACMFWRVARGRGQTAQALWLPLCLAQMFIVWMAQLACYYYGFLILSAPLAKRFPGIGPPLLGLAATSQFIVLSTSWPDDRYMLLSAACVAWTLYLLWASRERSSSLANPGMASQAPLS